MITLLNDEAQAWRTWIAVAHDCVETHWQQLSSLDQAIGDGDHGTNLRRGMAALNAKAGDVSELPFCDACKTAGMALVMNIGGASGPLFGSFLMGLGQGQSEMPKTQQSLTIALRSGLNALKSRGKSQRGAKTMIDVIEPVIERLEAGSAGLDDISNTAQEAALATIPLIATKGRAAFLGERSIGHMDPGAQSTALLITAICQSMREKDE
jgi:phosphoenolpyruvate---glycerone phosphotransferase subunit DhaL